MSRSVRWTFASLALFLTLSPLVLTKPGLPMTLKADEPAYYLMALSLVRDGDLACDVRDIERLGLEFPYLEARNLILATDDGWQTVVFGKPYLVSLVAAPLTALFGANGFVATNMALLLLAVWLGALYLRQFNPDGLSLLFSAGFFLLSNAFAYVFWLHTEILCATAVTACLYLALTPADEGPPGGRWAIFLRRFWNASTRPVFSGAVIVLAAYNKPYLVLLGLPALWVVYRRRGARGGLAWLAGAVAAAVVVCAISIALIGKPSAYLGFERAGISVDRFDQMPTLPSPQPLSSTGAPAASWAWIFHSFKIDANFPPNVLYFLVGRHTGLFLYAPFALLAVALFLVFSRRETGRWLLLAGLGGIAFYTLTFIWFNWHGGGGFVGNRYYVAAVPGFLFLVTRIAPYWLPAVGYALAGLFVGGIVLTPYGGAVPKPTLQAHTRNAPFRFFPFERTLSSQIPGHTGVVSTGGTYIFGRSDQFRDVGDGLWIVGGQRVELDFRVLERLRRPVFEVASRVTPNRIRIALGGSSTVVSIADVPWPENRQRVVLAPEHAAVAHDPEGNEYLAYLLTVEAERQVWHAETVKFRGSKKGYGTSRAAAAAEMQPDWEQSELRVLVGGMVTYLGEEAELAADVYSLHWLSAPLPATMPTNRILAFDLRVRNASEGVWRSRGATAVSIAYHWLGEDGTPVIWEGLRTPLRADVAPGEDAALRLEIETPERAGRYVLMLDGVRERIAWFSDRRPESSLRLPVEIADPHRPAEVAPAASHR